MGIRTNLMAEHLAQCAASGYKASDFARCPFLPDLARDAWQIGRFLLEQEMPLPQSVTAAGHRCYDVDGVIVEVNEMGDVQLLH